MLRIEGIIAAWQEVRTNDSSFVVNTRGSGSQCSWIVDPDKAAVAVTFESTEARIRAGSIRPDSAVPLVDTEDGGGLAKPGN